MHTARSVEFGCFLPLDMSDDDPMNLYARVRIARKNECMVTCLWGNLHGGGAHSLLVYGYIKGENEGKERK